MPLMEQEMIIENKKKKRREENRSVNDEEMMKTQGRENMERGNEEFRNDQTTYAKRKNGEESR